MITKVKKLFKNEAVSYLFWGVGATVVNWIVYTVLSFASPYSMVICNSIAWLAAVLFGIHYQPFFRFPFQNTWTDGAATGIFPFYRRQSLYRTVRDFSAVPAVPSGIRQTFLGIEGFLGKSNRYCADLSY